MDLDAFSQQVADVRARISQLDEHGGSISKEAVFQELEIALASLEVAYEELRQQNVELLDARHTIEVERQHYRNLFEYAPIGYLVTNLDGLILQSNHAAAQLLNLPQAHLPGKPLELYVASADKPLFRNHLLAHRQRLVASSTIEIQMQPRKKSPVTVNLTSSRVEMGNPVDTGANQIRWLLIDQSARKRAEAVEREREQRLLAEALHDTALHLASTLDQAGIVNAMLVNLKRIIPHDAAMVILAEADAVSLVQIGGQAAGRLDKFKVQMLDGTHSVKSCPICREMAEKQDVLLLPDWEVGAFHNAHGVKSFRSFLGAPIMNSGSVMGFICLYSVAPGFFTPLHASTLWAFTAQAATALQNARLYAQSRMLAVYEERQRLAREMHDAVSQTLYTSAMLAETLRDMLATSPDNLSDHLRDLQLLNRSALAEMRLILLELRPEQLGSAPLSKNLRGLVEAVRGRKNIDIDLRISEEGPSIPSDVRVAFYRVTQEALNNVLKHARAHRVQIELYNNPASLELIVHDDGCGFEVESVSSPGMGMETMRERASAIGAQLQVESVLNQGTCVRLRWPCPRAGQK